MHGLRQGTTTTEHLPSPSSRAGTDLPTDVQAVSRAVSNVNTLVSGSRLGPGLPTGVVYLIVIFVSVIILGGNPGCNGSLVSRRPPGRKHAAARTRDSAGQGCELHKLANRSKGHGAYDRTRYGRTRASPTSFVTHHTQQISKAAVVNDSRAILNCIISRKHKACSCTPSTTGAAYAAGGAWRA